MRRFLALILTLALLCPAVRASEEKYVALTFDDGPSGRFTRRLLEGLESRDVKVTFFLCGYRLKEYPGIAGEIFAQGHEIGLHGYSHQDMSKMSYDQLAREIRENLALLPTDCDPVLLRPPGGSNSKAVDQAAKDAGLALVKWSVDPRDWATHDATAVETAVVDTVQPGDIILMHDMCDCSVDAALAIIDRLQGQGFRFVTVSELAALSGTELTPGVMYTAFR